MSEWSFKQTEAHATWTPGLDYLSGIVWTPLGMVDVYSQGHDGNHYEASTYRTIIGGRMYGKSERVARSQRGLSIMAHRWIKEIVADLNCEAP